MGLRYRNDDWLWGIFPGHRIGSPDGHVINDGGGSYLQRPYSFFAFAFLGPVDEDIKTYVETVKLESEIAHIKQEMAEIKEMLQELKE